MSKDYTISQDLTMHLADNIRECCFRTMDLIPSPGEACGVAISAMLINIDSCLTAYENNGCPPEIIQNYRRELAARILGTKTGSVVIDKTGIHSLEDSQ